MRKLERLIVGVATAAALTAAAPAFGSGPPAVNDHYRFTSDPYAQSWCGAVAGTAVDTVVEHYMEDANGNIVDNVRITSVFTATATGKSIESSASSTTKVAGPIDNRDGTFSFVAKTTGLVLQFKIPRGPVLKAANGEPLRSSGELVIEDVFDAATGDYITTRESFHGPHLVREGVDICGPSVAYLMDP
jgi:hypothetical protein